MALTACISQVSLVRFGDSRASGVGGVGGGVAKQLAKVPMASRRSPCPRPSLDHPSSWLSTIATLCVKRGPARGKNATRVAGSRL